jgi:hypothetical protein
MRRNLERTTSDVRSITGVHRGQFARFETAVCPLVLGVERRLAVAIEERIRLLAEQIGLRGAKAGCATNLTIIAADDGRRVILALQKKFPRLLESLSGAEATRLKQEPGPVWNWYSIDPKRRDGAPVEHVSQVAFGSGPPKPVSPNAYIASNVTMSRLTEPVRMELAHSFVVISSDAARGLNVQQFGDLAGVLALSTINTKGVGQLSTASVLQLLSTDTASKVRIEGATAFDLAYLRALYSGDAGYSADQQAVRLALSIMRSRGEATQTSRDPDAAADSAGGPEPSDRSR